EEAARLEAARAQWEHTEAELRAKARAEWQTETESQTADVESRLMALYDMQLTAAEMAWHRGESERLATAEVAWRKGEAERLAAAETRWRAEHQKRLDVVLANVATRIQGQLGSVSGSQPLPAIIPPALPMPNGAAPAAGETVSAEVVESHSNLRRSDNDDLGGVNLWPAVAAA